MVDSTKKENRDKKREDAEEILKMECRMYENKYPAKDDLVMVPMSLILVFNQNNI